MTPQQFVAKWQEAELSERSACQQHFLDLCDVLRQPKPADVDPTGAWYTFEKGVEKTAGGKGFADVWMRGKFGWEYKGKHKDLKAAYAQLLQYREALENPPLLIVCDLDRFEIHTNFTGTIKQVFAFDLDGLADSKNLQTLRYAFTNPDALKPGLTPEGITQEIAERFAKLADGIQKRGVEPLKAAHFLMKLMFCMFAEDIELLPKELFTKTVTNARNDPARLSTLLKALFAAMETGGDFGPEIIEWFNGGLFADHEVIDLTTTEIKELLAATQADWSNVEPTIFGTLFERTLDPDKRSQIGAHYTSRADIETLLKPVMMEPLRREWGDVKAKAEALYAKIKGGAGKGSGKRTDSKERQAFDKCLQEFAERLAHVEVLDPACGSGNFLYVAINLLLELEKEVLTFAAERGLTFIPGVRPTQLHGLEINTYAAELAQVVIWIGFLQWMHFNGYIAPRDPVLQNVHSIIQQDSIIDLSDPENPKEPKWPKAEFIIGNPPFLGTKKLRGELGDAYVEKVFKLWGNRIPNFSDLCCYWFEKSRAAIEAGETRRAGLIATQGIRGGQNREVLKRIKKSGGIFFAESDRDWILDGASVHISMVGFDNGSEHHRVLDGIEVPTINSNLTSAADITQSKRLEKNRAIGFIADVKAGKFDLSYGEALELLHEQNPHGRPNSDVLRSWMNTLDVTRRSRDIWIIDFGSEMSEEHAALYEKPFELVRERVKPARDKVKRDSYRLYWWLHAEPCAKMRQLIEPLDRFLSTTTTSKHRPFVWLPPIVLPDHQLVAFARNDDFGFGVLHSRVHELWARSQGTQCRERESGFRYTPTTCFETFPFPNPSKAQEAAIASAAKELDALRNNWLNPPEWTKTETLEFPGSVDGPWKRYVHEPDARGIGTVRYPRLVAKDDAAAAKLKKRTLTNLYNEMPTWLKNAHAKLDEAVFAAYGWPVTLSDDELLAKLLALNLERAKGS